MSWMMTPATFIHPKVREKIGVSARRREEEEDDGDDDGGAKVSNAVGEPGEDVENDVLVSGEDVAEVCAVEDVLQRWEDAHPGLGANGARDELARVEENQVAGEGQERQEELARYGADQGGQEQRGNEGAEERARKRHDGEAEDANDGLCTKYWPS